MWHFLHALKIFMLGLGPVGMFLIAVMDSSSIPFPPDFILVLLAMQNPHGLVLYTLVAAAGSTVGSVIVFAIARHWGGPWVERHMAHRRFKTIQRRLEEYDVLAVAVPALLPPPVPLKMFIVAAGVFEISYGQFALWTFIGRAVRYFIEAWLALRYGSNAIYFFKQHYLISGGIVLAFLVAGLIVGRFREAEDEAVAASSQG
jgi:membrane protein YqaA with SNARE-associated domain